MRDSIKLSIFYFVFKVIFFFKINKYSSFYITFLDIISVIRDFKIHDRNGLFVYCN